MKYDWKVWDGGAELVIDELTKLIVSPTESVLELQCGDKYVVYLLCKAPSKKHNFERSMISGTTHSTVRGAIASAERFIDSVRECSGIQWPYTIGWPGQERYGVHIGDNKSVVSVRSVPRRDGVLPVRIDQLQTVWDSGEPLDNRYHGRVGLWGYNPVQVTRGTREIEDAMDRVDRWLQSVGSLKRKEEQP